MYVGSSWIISPIIGCIVSCVCWYLLKTFIVESPHPRYRTRIALPILVAFTILISLLFLVYKGFKGLIKDLDSMWYLWYIIVPILSLVLSIFVGIFIWLVILPKIQKKVEQVDLMDEDVLESNDEKLKNVLKSPKNELDTISDVSSVVSSPDLGDLRKNEKDEISVEREVLMNEKSERLSFRYLALLTSCCIAMGKFFSFY